MPTVLSAPDTGEETARCWDKLTLRGEGRQQPPAEGDTPRDSAQHSLPTRMLLTQHLHVSPGCSPPPFFPLPRKRQPHPWVTWQKELAPEAHALWTLPCGVALDCSVPWGPLTGLALPLQKRPALKEQVSERGDKATLSCLCEADI